MASCPYCNEVYIGFHHCSAPDRVGEGSRYEKCGQMRSGIHVCSK